MSNKRACNSAPDAPRIYEIRLEGHLGHQWADWFDGLAITLEDNGHTVMTGPVVDQAALYSLLTRVRDLGLPLCAVNYLSPAEIQS